MAIIQIQYLACLLLSGFQKALTSFTRRPGFDNPRYVPENSGPVSYCRMEVIMRCQPILTVLLLTIPALCVAAEPASVPEGIEVKVSLGTKDGKYSITPNNMTFERGKYYKLVIHNPSSEDHYFTSDAFATHVFTRKVEVTDGTGKTIAEVHGAVNDLELKPGATVTWYFYPMTKGEKLHLFCHKEGHEAKGMTGSINIVGPPPFSN